MAKGQPGAKTPQLRKVYFCCYCTIVSACILSNGGVLAGNKLMSGSMGGSHCYVRPPLIIVNIPAHLHYEIFTFQLNWMIIFIVKRLSLSYIFSKPGPLPPSSTQSSLLGPHGQLSILAQHHQLSSLAPHL